MNAVEIYAKFKLRAGEFARYNKLAESIAIASRERGSGTLRCDWFANEAQQEGVAVLVHRDAAAMQAHWLLNGEDYAELAACGDISVEFLGKPTEAALQTLSRLKPGSLDFAFGIQATPGARQVSRLIEPAAAAAIEIYTRFVVQPGRTAEFKQVAAELLALVKQQDPATSRYDWFFGRAGQVSVAMDTYDSAAAMFAHMRNCHDVHEKLLHMSTMVTEFLGDLPPEAQAAVAKYDPYIARFIVGLKPYSACGFI